MQYAIQMRDLSRRQTKRAALFSAIRGVVVLLELIGLWRLFRIHRNRMIKAAAVSAPNTALSTTSLWVLAVVLGLGALLAYLINMLCLSAVGFFLNKVVWRDRNTKNIDGVKRWAKKECGMHVAGPVFFLMMIELLGFPLMFANFSKMVAFALPTYALNNWVFKHEPNESEGSTA